MFQLFLPFRQLFSGDDDDSDSSLMVSHHDFSFNTFCTLSNLSVNGMNFLYMIAYTST